MIMLKSLRACVSAAALLAVLCFAAAPFAQAQTSKPVPGELKVRPDKDTTSDTTAPDKNDAKDRDKDKKDEEKEPRPSVTEHKLTVGGKSIRYRATTGSTVMREWTEATSSADGERAPRG